MSQTDQHNAPVSDGRDTRKDRLEFNKLRKRLRRQTGKAIADFNMIEAGDRIMVCISGGKDSHAMLELLISLRSSAPIDFEIVAVTLDQKQPGYPEDVLPDYLETLGVPFYILEKDTTASCAASFPKARRPVACARGCAGARSMALPSKLVRPKLPWAIIVTTLWKRCFSICFSGASSRPCRRN